MKQPLYIFSNQASFLQIRTWQSTYQSLNILYMQSIMIQK